MSQTEKKYHKIQIKNKEYADGKLTTGFNARVLLDGQPLKGCTFLKLELKPGRVAKVLIELVAEVDADVTADADETRWSGRDDRTAAAKVRAKMKLKEDLYKRRNGDG